MSVRIEALLSKSEVATFRAVLEAAPWVDGRVTAGVQSAGVKDNLHAPEDAPGVRALGETLLGALGRNERFVSAALPLRVFPPLFNRYEPGMGFGAHVDNAIRFAGNVRFRTDLSATLFLTEPEDYDGGELVIEDSFGEHRVKLGAGDMVLYPAGSVHRVTPVTRGTRLASFFWVQSMVRDTGRREQLFRLDEAIGQVRAELGDGHTASVALTSSYHNLLRGWSEV